ncbi:MAG: IS110 family transposase [Elusimicrobiota bacterium]
MSDAALFWVGLDVAKATFDAALASPGEHANARSLKALPAATFERTAEGVSKLVRWLCEQVAVPGPLPVRVVMEATGMYSIELAALLCKRCPELRPAIVNPEWTSAFCDSLGLRNKTDRLDARALAFFGLERCPDPYEPLCAEQAELRALCRFRESLVAQRVAYESQLEQGPESAFVKKTLKRNVAGLAKDIDKIEREMHRVIRSHAQLRGDYELLISIPGVGFITAAVVLAELGDLRRFGSSRQIGAHAGVTPRKVESGSCSLPGHMSKKGNAHVRHALYMAALSAKTFNPQMRDLSRRLIANGKKPMVAIGAIMRKLLVLMRAVVKSGKPFDPCGKHREKLSDPCPKTA